MSNVINIYKEIGKTPLEKIKELKIKYPQYKDKKIAYAGRLDPMAHGVLLLLVEPETKNRKSYERLDKVYKFKMMFGVATDSYDVLGLITKTKTPDNLDPDSLKQMITSFKGTIKQAYPPFSAVRVNGKSLFTWAREGKLTNIVIPEKNITIHSIKLLYTHLLDPQTVHKKILENIGTVSGDFRQDTIIKQWDKYFASHDKDIFIAEMIAECSSGTYIRSIVHEIGKKLGTGATSYEILRTKVGQYKLEHALRLINIFSGV